MSANAAPSSSGRFAHVGVLTLTVAVFAGVVGAVTLQLRAGLREQMLRREAGTLEAVTLLQLDNAAAEYGEVALAEVPGALFVAVLKTARYREVVAVRILDRTGAFNSADGILDEMEPPSVTDWRRVSGGEAFARLHARPVRPDVFLLPEAVGAEGLLEAWVPLRRTGVVAPLGAAQFWLRGGAVRAEIRAHDRRLWLQAALAWGAGSLVIVLALGWAFRRLDNANRELQARSEDLVRANRELVLAAKTSALGAVTAHLMHALKNPIAGLEMLMAGHAEMGGANASGDAGAELRAASELTRRLRTMVNDVVGVLRDEQSGTHFLLTCAEVAEIVQGKVQSEAARRRVRVECVAAAEVSLAGRRANLATLVLGNLVQNALEASPAGGSVRITGGDAGGGRVEFVVQDGGPGLPEAVRARLFQPCPTSKSGGSGLGLALSQQLAQQAGGRLELVRSDAQGTSFRLVLEPEA